MKQLKEPFLPCYYLKQDGTILNKSNNKIIKPNSKHAFVLMTIDNKRKKISLKKLYYDLFGIQYCKDNIKDLDGEQWKEIENTCGKWFVSNQGRIKSLVGYDAKILKGYKSKSSPYERIDIYIDGKRVSKLIHRLVALYFLPTVQPANPFEIEIHHKDGNRLNNRVSNLCYVNKDKHMEYHNN